MTHPALLILAKNPEILADHAEAYTDLIAECLKSMLGHWQRRAVCNIAAGLCLTLSVLFAGVAIMLWGVVVGLTDHVQWALIAVPVAPLVMALGLWQYRFQLPKGTDGIEIVKRQMRADLAVLRQKSPS
jgi:hypothetical protein